MKIKILIIFIISLLFLVGGVKLALANERVEKSGLFSMDIPETWRWIESPQEIIITYPDGQTVAIEIQLVPSRKLSPDEIKKTLKESNDKMIKEGIEAHHGTLVDDKQIKVDGVYATQLDFKTPSQNPVDVTYISFFNKDFAFTIIYGTRDDKMRLLMDDVVTSFKFGKGQ